MPVKNMDCFFKLDVNTFTIGAVSPLNSGWYVAIPNLTAYEYMKEKALWRLSRDWDVVNGWEQPIPTRLTVRGGQQHVKKWEFNGADMDQGLLCHYFIIKFGNGMLIDANTKVVRRYERGLDVQNEKTLDMKQALLCCGGGNPLSFFAHFTGRSKPWMNELKNLPKNRKNEMLIKWANHLDSMDLPIKSHNIKVHISHTYKRKVLFALSDSTQCHLQLKLKDMGLGSPLGFWNAKFPKGGFTDKVKEKVKKE